MKETESRIMIFSTSLLLFPLEFLSHLITTWVLGVSNENGSNHEIYLFTADFISTSQRFEDDDSSTLNNQSTAKEDINIFTLPHLPQSKLREDTHGSY